MNRIILFVILIAAGGAIYAAWLFFSQRQAAYLSILLYQNGDADAYLKELESPSSKFFFNKKLRTLMAVDAAIMKEDDEKIQQLFQKAETYHLRPADQLLLLQKELNYYAEKNETQKAAHAYACMKELYQNKLSAQKKKNYEALMRESSYINAIFVAHDGRYAEELMKQAEQLKDEIPSGIDYYRAAQSYYLQHELKKCRSALNKAEQKLRNTGFHQEIKKILKDGNYEALIKTKQ